MITDKVTAVPSIEEPIFIVGLPRSGSTLWFNVLKMHPQIFGIGEMLFLNAPWREDFRQFVQIEVGDMSTEERVRKLVDLMFSGEKIRGLNTSFWQYTAKYYAEPELKDRIVKRVWKSRRFPGSVFKALVEEIPAYFGFTRCCVKFPVYMHYMSRLLQWYPNCRIIHIARDPRALAVSRVMFGGERRQFNIWLERLRIVNRLAVMLFVVGQYLWASHLHSKYKSVDNYALFRYEDLLARPEATIKELCAFANIQFVPEMLHPSAGQPSSVTGTLVPDFDPKAANRWKTAIRPLEERAITWLTAPAMRQFGYEPDSNAGRDRLASAGSE